MADLQIQQNEPTITVLTRSPALCGTTCPAAPPHPVSSPTIGGAVHAPVSPAGGSAPLTPVVPPDASPASPHTATTPIAMTQSCPVPPPPSHPLHVPATPPHMSSLQPTSSPVSPLHDPRSTSPPQPSTFPMPPPLFQRMSPPQHSPPSLPPSMSAPQPCAPPISPPPPPPTSPLPQTAAPLSLSSSIGYIDCTDDDDDFMECGYEDMVCTVNSSCSSPLRHGNRARTPGQQHTESCDGLCDPEAQGLISRSESCCSSPCRQRHSRCRRNDHCGGCRKISKPETQELRPEIRGTRCRNAHGRSHAEDHSKDREMISEPETQGLMENTRTEPVSNRLAMNSAVGNRKHVTGTHSACAYCGHRTGSWTNQKCSDADDDAITQNATNSRLSKSNSRSRRKSSIGRNLQNLAQRVRRRSGQGAPKRTHPSRSQNPPPGHAHPDHVASSPGHVSRKSCSKQRCYQMAIAGCYLLIAVIAIVVTYSMVTNLVHSLQYPVRSIKFNKVKEQTAPGECRHNTLGPAQFELTQNQLPD